jgi:hypothetical protein
MMSKHCWRAKISGMSSPWRHSSWTHSRLPFSSRQAAAGARSTNPKNGNVPNSRRFSEIDKKHNRKFEIAPCLLLSAKPVSWTESTYRYVKPRTVERLGYSTISLHASGLVGEGQRNANLCCIIYYAAPQNGFHFILLIGWPSVFERFTVLVRSTTQFSREIRLLRIWSWTAALNWLSLYDRVFSFRLVSNYFSHRII